ncbi:V-type ATP synthase subunit E [Halorubrum lacusprofundi]|jgi:V/A-type H+-transporting ATPase subunit E|uniref:A-type ATP synthase subunit E n=1 Tax=Halorubrum lacusprofundi (strain ATCC 49239 / DSM 5036 / JCM 8891 / ACAM 34) TaxID=416348 RepID=AATE_HALLT|nr:V-type ATP synthase subunit E [Halorubrum lacusprofundi]B9LS38.1 RecName: Full=V-type proton ATPase subunit E; AltName: Full=V-ATPase subunit E [Halorubrum lacusprofundi ATCC 49239]ACM55883.1 H+transporting two-sector ATPase E subunit [Halorubrum lacusprofundi ATCC 49239]MCG1006752.1 V-type ATP synthase subunit E [Halorubrum lacusprofundi]
MSLDTVVEDVRDEARARAEDIREAAESEADEIVAEAEADAERIREERLAEVDRQIDQEREQTLSSAKLEAKQERLGARRDVLEDVYDDVEAAIEGLDGDRRRELTETLLDATLAEFDDDEDVAVYTHTEDVDLVEELVEDRNAVVDGEIDCLGGVVAESDTSRVRVNNTFDSILESVWDDELKNISERLFDQ